MKYRFPTGLGTYHTSLVLDTRPLLPEHLDPAVHRLAHTQLWFKHRMQVLVNSIGGQAWITINKRDMIWN